MPDSIDATRAICVFSDSTHHGTHSPNHKRRLTGNLLPTTNHMRFPQNGLFLLLTYAPFPPLYQTVSKLQPCGVNRTMRTVLPSGIVSATHIHAPQNPWLCYILPFFCMHNRLSYSFLFSLLSRLSSFRILIVPYLSRIRLESES